MSDPDPLAPVAPDLERRTLTPFGYGVAIAVPVLIAVLGLVFLHFHYSPDDLVEGERVPLLTSSWIPGQAGDDALITGELTLDDGCVRLVGTDGTEITPVWPAGFEASVFGEELRLYDDDRTVVARGGNLVQMGGGYQPVGAYAGHECAPASGEVAIVQSEVQVTG